MIPGLASRAGVAVPLEAVSIGGDLVAGHALLRVTQSYRHPRADDGDAEPIEAVYTFPLPAEGAVVGFRYRCGERELEGEIREREIAFREYDEALRQGHGAALVERERADVFTASVGNLLPGERVEIEVEVLLPLEPVDGRLRLKIPTLVPPRYISGSPGGARTGFGAADPTDLVPDADRITPPIHPDGDPGYRASLDLAVALGYPVAIESPSHALDITEDEDGTFHVTFKRGAVALDRDLVLRLAPARVEATAASATRTAPGLVADRKKGRPGTFALTVVPELGGERAGRRALDVVFLLDRSGSMGGDSIVEARRAVCACLRQLRRGDRFAILAFDTEIESFGAFDGPFGEKLVPFDEATLDRATRWVESIEARGGTELGGAIDRALPLLDKGVLVILTDAQVGDEETIAARFDPRHLPPAKRPRVFSFGIGTNVASGLLADLAQATGGAVEEIHPGEEIAEKVVAQLARATSLLVDDLKIAIDGVETTDLVPSAATLTDGEPFTLLGRYPKAGRGRITLRGKLEGTPYRLDAPLHLPVSGSRGSRESRASRSPLLRLWAARRIAQLERERAALGNPRRAKAVGEQILALSLEHRVLCADTAFLVVEKRNGARKRAGATTTAVVPVHAPAGWAMMEDIVGSSVAACAEPVHDHSVLCSHSIPFDSAIPLSKNGPWARALRSSQPPFADDWPFLEAAPGGDDSLIRSGLESLLHLLDLEGTPPDAEWDELLADTVPRLFEALDRWPEADEKLHELALRLALLLKPQGALRRMLEARASALGPTYIDLPNATRAESAPRIAELARHADERWGWFDLRALAEQFAGIRWEEEDADELGLET